MKKFISALLCLFVIGEIAAQCDTVSLSITDITATSARFRKTPTGAAGTATLKYVKQGTTDTVSVFIGVVPVVITTLTPNTTYRAYISNVCVGVTYNQTLKQSFTTAQQYTPMTAQGYSFKRLEIANMLHIPFVDTATAMSGAITRPGGLVMHTGDSTIYAWRGASFVPVNPDVSEVLELLDQKVDSVTTSVDSLFYWKNGVAYGEVFNFITNQNGQTLTAQTGKAWISDTLKTSGPLIAGNGLFYGIDNYAANYGSSFTNRTKVDKGYVDSVISALGLSGYVTLVTDQTITGEKTFTQTIFANAGVDGPFYSARNTLSSGSPVSIFNGWNAETALGVNITQEYDGTGYIMRLGTNDNNTGNPITAITIDRSQNVVAAGTLRSSSTKGFGIGEVGSSYARILFNDAAYPDNFSLYQASNNLAGIRVNAVVAGAISGTDATFTSLTSGAVYSNAFGALSNTAPTSGTIGYWSRTGTTLSPATSTDNISMTGNIVAGDITGAAGTFTNNVQIGAVGVGDKYINFIYGANAASRSWRMGENFTTPGDFSIQQSTTRTGGVYANALYFDASRNATLSGSLTGTSASFSSNLTAANGTFTNTSLYNNYSTAALRLINGANTNKQLYAGYDNSQDYAFLQGHDLGIAYKTLALNPNGGLVKVGSGGLEVNGQSSGVTVGDFYVDPSAKTVYAGRLSTTGSDNSTFIVRNRVNANILKVDAGLQTTDITGTLTVTSDLRVNGIYRDSDGEALLVTQSNITKLGSAGAGNVRSIEIYAGNTLRNTVHSSGYFNFHGANSYVRFSNSANTIRWGYINHNGTNLVYSSDIGTHVFDAAGVPVSVSSTNNNYYKIRFQDNGTDRSYIGGDASNFAIANASATEVARVNLTTGAYTATSDERAKKNIKDAAPALATLLQIKIKEYDWKANNSHEPYGVVAQDLYKVLPMYVSKPANDSTGRWGVAKAELVPMTIKAIQELDQKIIEQAAKILALESALKKLQTPTPKP